MAKSFLMQNILQLNGLPNDFDLVVTLITTSRKDYDVPALFSILIDPEAR